MLCVVFSVTQASTCAICALAPSLSLGRALRRTFDATLRVLVGWIEAGSSSGWKLVHVYLARPCRMIFHFFTQAVRTGLQCTRDWTAGNVLRYLWCAWGVQLPRACLLQRCVRLVQPSKCLGWCRGVFVCRKKISPSCRRMALTVSNGAELPRVSTFGRSERSLSARKRHVRIRITVAVDVFLCICRGTHSRRLDVEGTAVTAAAAAGTAAAAAAKLRCTYVYSKPTAAVAAAAIEPAIAA